LRALEAAISARAKQAARALGVPYPAVPAFEVEREQLHRLLQALCAEGMVLPPESGLLAPDRRHAPRAVPPACAGPRYPFRASCDRIRDGAD
jgi:hypothetical protein